MVFWVGWGAMDLQSNNFMHVLKIKCSRSCVDEKFCVASPIERNSLVRNELYCASFGFRTAVLIISIVSLNCYLEGRGGMSYKYCTSGSAILSYSTTTATSCCIDVTLLPHVCEFHTIQIE